MSFPSLMLRLFNGCAQEFGESHTPELVQCVSTWRKDFLRNSLKWIGTRFRTMTSCFPCLKPPPKKTKQSLLRHEFKTILPTLQVRTGSWVVPVTYVGANENKLVRVHRKWTIYLMLDLINISLGFLLDTSSKDLKWSFFVVVSSLRMHRSKNRTLFSTLNFSYLIFRNFSIFILYCTFLG